MTASRKQCMTSAEFLDWEDAQPERYEFDGENVVEMMTVTLTHATIDSSLIATVGNRLARKPCRIVGSQIMIEINGRYRYPDAIIYRHQSNKRARLVEAPVVLFEIISESTTGIDMHDKTAEYLSIPSLRRYVILEQASISATVWSLESNRWIGHRLAADESIDMPEVDISVPLAELYDGIDFSEPAESA